MCGTRLFLSAPACLLPSFLRGRDRRLAELKTGTAIALGALLGLALGFVVSVITDVPLAPEAGLVLGALVGYLARRERA
jgi:uncharacterized membrane protein YfcA